ncbi:MAG: hypothetical protein V2A73_22150 [Pseudomonadota bacterium]
MATGRGLLAGAFLPRATVLAPPIATTIIGAVASILAAGCEEQPDVGRPTIRPEGTWSSAAEELASVFPMFREISVGMNDSRWHVGENTFVSPPGYRGSQSTVVLPRVATEELALSFGDRSSYTVGLTLSKSAVTGKLAGGMVEYPGTEEEADLYATATPEGFLWMYHLHSGRAPNELNISMASDSNTVIRRKGEHLEVVDTASAKAIARFGEVLVQDRNGTRRIGRRIVEGRRVAATFDPDGLVYPVLLVQSLSGTGNRTALDAQDRIPKGRSLLFSVTAKDGYRLIADRVVFGSPPRSSSTVPPRDGVNGLVAVKNDSNEVLYEQPFNLPRELYSEFPRPDGEWQRQGVPLDQAIIPVRLPLFPMPVKLELYLVEAQVGGPPKLVASRPAHTEWLQPRQY